MPLPAPDIQNMSDLLNFFNSHASDKPAELMRHVFSIDGDNLKQLLASASKRTAVPS